MDKSKLLEHHSLSNFELQEALNNDVNIIKYSDIEDNNYNTIEELFENNKYVIILFDIEAKYGHWTLLFRIGNKEISFFDSYGLNIEHQRMFIPDIYKKSNYPCFHILQKLLYEYKKRDVNNRVSYNNYKLQGIKNKSETCGYWCIYRAKNDNLTVDGFYKLFKDIGNKDNAVILLANKYI